MRVLSTVVLLAGMGLTAVGCGSGIPFDGPTVKTFVGRLTHNGEAVSFPEGVEVTLKVWHEKGQSFGVPIQRDGSFDVGWMPIGKYSAVLMQDDKVAGRPPGRYNVPGGFTIEDGKTDYTIELGAGFKP